MSNVHAEQTMTVQVETPTTRRRIGRAAALVTASGGLMVGLSLPADAAEITPVARYLDHTVSSTESELGGALAALGIHP